MLRIAVNGACGRMGGRLVALIAEEDDMTLAAAIDSPQHPAQGKDIGETHQLGPMGVAVKAALETDADVLIDFSSPEASVARAKECAARGVAMVIGTTGHSDDQLQAIRAAAETIACLMAPNMSLGVNLLFKLTEQVAGVLGPEWDAEIVEMHHRFKKDAPSGTALRLAERLAAGRGVNLDAKAVYGRQGLVGERPAGQIGVHAVRGGDVVGEHTVIFAALGERIELKHIASSRDTFARGALAAARFVASASPGLYGMDALLPF